MSAGVAVEAPMPSVLKSSRALWLILEAAEQRGLPLPYNATATDYEDHIGLQFRSRDEVVTWAELLEVDLDESESVYQGAPSHRVAATGEWLDVTIRAVAVKHGSAW